MQAYKGMRLEVLRRIHSIMAHQISCVSRIRLLGLVTGSLGLLQLRCFVCCGLWQGCTELSAGCPGDCLCHGCRPCRSRSASFVYLPRETNLEPCRKGFQWSVVPMLPFLPRMWPVKIFEQDVLYKSHCSMKHLHRGAVVKL